MTFKSVIESSCIIVIIVLSNIFFVSEISAQPCVCGTLPDNTIWEDDTVKVCCDVYGTRLTINPGVVVEFQGPYKLDIDKLYAIGSQDDTIKFTMNDTTGFSNHDIESGGWKGIRSDQIIILDYCKIEFGKFIGIGVNSYEEQGIVFLKSNEAAEEYYCHIKNSVFENNYSNSAGIVYQFFDAGYYSINNCIFLNNDTIALRLDHDHIITNCQIMNTNGAGIISSSEWASSIIVNNQIKNNNGWGIRIGGDDHNPALIQGNEITDNTGGISASNNGTLDIVKNVILNNEPKGGIHIYLTVFQSRLINNLICNNTSSFSNYSGGVSIGYTSCNAINNTICNNSSEYGGGLFLDNSSIDITNTIIWGNNASTEGDQIYCYNSDIMTLDEFNANVRYSDIENGLAGVVSLGLNGNYWNNIDQDPDFVDPASDFQLSSISSSCVDAGSGVIGLGLPETDLAGNQRISGSYIDIGAYEFQSIIPARPGTITGETSVCQGSSHIYIISPVSGATSYTWTLPPGWNGSSASTSITATAGATGGTISVTASNSYGTSSPSTLSVSVTTTDILKTVNEEELMLCYPNPVTDILHIVINSAEYNEYLIELYDNTGIKCNTYNFNDKHVTIDLTNYPPAVYILRLIEHNGIYLNKAYIIKIHK